MEMKNLKTAIVLRHGEDNGTGFLTQEADEAIGRLAAELKATHLKDAQRFCLLSSGQLRAIRTLGRIVVSAEIQETEQIVPELFSRSGEYDVDKVMSEIESRCKDADTLVVVTHLELVPALTTELARRLLGLEVHPIGARKGGGYLIDVPTNTCKIVSA